MAQRQTLLMTVVVAWLVSACGSDGPSPNASGGLFVGTWRGTLTDNANGPGSFDFALTPLPFPVPDNPTVTAIARGSWSATLGGQTTSGTALGGNGTTPDGRPLHTLTASCSLTASILFNASFQGNRITGTYTSRGCPGFSEGTFDGTKQ